MSAYMCDHIHIDALVTWAFDHDVRYYHAETWHHVNSFSAQETGEMLLRENERSVRYRYPGSDDLPGRIGEAVDNYRWRHFPHPLTAIEAIKLCRCLAYQSCETDDWETTPAFALLRAIEHHAVNGLPGYDAAPWGISKETVGKLTHGRAHRLSVARYGR